MQNDIVKYRTERRLSLKILAHKIRKISPVLMYNTLLVLRYFFFKRKCTGSNMARVSYSDGSWVTRKTSSDLILIQKYLAKQSEISILQIGTGNMSLYKSLKSQLASFYGVTIVEDEEHYARNIIKKLGDQNAHIFRFNKYTGDYTFLKNKKMDFIIDNDLSSYACCIFHFHEMMKAYENILKPGGSILVGLKGCGYFDSGFGLTSTQIENLGARLGLVVTKSEFCYHLTKQINS